MSEAAVVSATPVFEGLSVDGTINTPDATLLANVQASVRRGYPQIFPTPMNAHRIALVGGGPSLSATLPELRDLVFAGAKLVALNGAYQWLIDRNFQPRAHIVLDARPETAAFITAPVPECRYYICSQCAPETWDALGDRPNVAIWHASGDDAVSDFLDNYYLKHWSGVTGGTTVATRAIGLLRMLGFLRFDLFGIDSCWMGDQHHAFPQPQNDTDRRYRLTIEAIDSTRPARDFWVAPWHVKQLEDLILFMRAHGEKFLLNIHGDGLLAYALAAHADVHYTVDKE
jgi:hypothetical protein